MVAVGNTCCGVSKEGIRAPVVAEEVRLIQPASFLSGLEMDNLKLCVFFPFLHDRWGSDELEDNVMALSPLDGRYAQKVKALRQVFSEYALIGYRVLVEVFCFDQCPLLW